MVVETGNLDALMLQHERHRRTCDRYRSKTHPVFKKEDVKLHEHKFYRKRDMQWLRA